MLNFDCGKCVLPINIPDDWTDEKKAEVAALIRTKDSFLTVQYFRPVGMDLGDAKGIFLHVTREKGALSSLQNGIDRIRRKMSEMQEVKS